MAYKKVNKETGFIEYHRTPEETVAANLQKENKELKKRLEVLEQKMLNSSKKK